MRWAIAAGAVLAIVGSAHPTGSISAAPAQAAKDRPARPGGRETSIPARIGPGPAGDTIRLGFCGGDDWEPEIAAHQNYVYVVWAHFPGDPSCDPASANPQRVYIQVSDDGGRTFGPLHVVSDRPGQIEFPAQVDATVAVNEQGWVFVCFLGYGFDDLHSIVACARSTDHGETFPVSRIVSGAACFDCDHEWPVAHGKDVYVAFAGNGNNDHFLAHSSDGGLTWDTVRIEQGPRWEVSFPEGAVVDGAGNAWFAWGDCKGACQGRHGAIYRVSRTRAGTTDTVFAHVASGPQGPDCPVECGFAYFGPQDDIAIDAAGNLYVVYQDGQQHTVPKSPPVVRLVRCRAFTDCTNSGNWKRLGRVDDKTAGPGCAQGSCYALFPRIEGGAANEIHAIWMDDRKGGPSHRSNWNVWLRRSVDGGETWAPSVPVSQYDPSRPESQPNGFRFPYGDYQGVDITPAGDTVMTWGEGVDYFATLPGHVIYRLMPA